MTRSRISARPLLLAPMARQEMGSTRSKVVRREFPRSHEADGEPSHGLSRRGLALVSVLASLALWGGIAWAWSVLRLLLG